MLHYCWCIQPYLFLVLYCVRQLYCVVCVCIILLWIVMLCYIFLWHMWPHLRKDTLHTHNSKTQYSSSNDSCIHRLTIQASIDAESCLGCFCWGLFLRFVRRPWVLGLSSNGSISLGKQTAGCNSPHDWLMNSQLVLHDTQVSCFSYLPVNNQNQSDPSYTGFMPILLIL